MYRRTVRKSELNPSLLTHTAVTVTVAQDRAGSTELGDTVSPGAAVVVGAAAESGTGLLVEAVALPEVR